ncbi:NEDD4-binding protein 2-like 1 [Chionoecetes opilio]|uniref:NEDD4-binding protein 2-like 1 n=1 Tax=Chionoecetes opilio TaxID=41210 RepID=A0A8J5CG12_CHIOP|nr:NEDD4-binding protein 2-like 1 [Chionoecetes opilio]
MTPEFVPDTLSGEATGADRQPSVWPQSRSSVVVASASSPNRQSKDKLNEKEQMIKFNDKLNEKERIIDKILRGRRLLVVMRGLPGSGKTTLAREVKGPNGVVLSTDDFFCDKHGQYLYDASRIGEAHQWNKHRTIKRLKQGKTPILIDNTNLEVWEMKPYFQLALQYGYDVDLLHTATPWRRNAKELARKSIHGVPAKKIEEMKERYEQDVRIEDIITDLQGSEMSQQSPRRSVTSKSNADVTLESKFKDMEITAKNSPLKRKNKLATGQVTEQDAAVKLFGDFDSSIGDMVYDSDEDVIVEGYEEMPVVTIFADSNKKQDSKVDQSNIVFVCEVQEASDDQERLAGNAVSEVNETLSKKDPISEDSDSLIDLTVQTRGLKDEERKGLEERKDEGMLDSTDHAGDEPVMTCTNESGTSTDVCDEVKIQHLLDEACKSIDVSKSEEEWDNLTSHIAGEDFSDEKFNDLVTSFGTALKKQIENKGVTETKDHSVTPDTMSEDSAMYDLCYTMEDKTGQPLSALITKLTLKEDSGDLTFTHSAGEHNENKKCKLSLGNESQTHNLTRNVLTLKEEKHTDNLTCSAEENSKPGNEKDSHDISKSSNQNQEKRRETNKQDVESEDITATECHIPDEPSKPASTDTTHMQTDTDGLTSWECIDIHSGLSSTNWDAKPDGTDSDNNDHIPKPSRTQRNRISGDPQKWLHETDTQNEGINDSLTSWVPVESGTPEWDTSETTQASKPESSPSQRVVAAPGQNTEAEAPSNTTGAISKLRKNKRRNNSPAADSGSGGKGDVVQANDCKTVVTLHEGTKTVFKSSETQTLSIDFEALELDHNLYELKVLFGQSHYIPVTTVSSSFNEKGPLTKGELRLDKGTMTDNPHENPVVSSFQNLVAFFPNIPKEDLRDVYEKCKHDSDWAMNVLMDSGYEMSDPSDVTAIDVADVENETDSVSETTNTDDGRNDQSSSDAYDIPSDSLSDERTRKIKQSQLPEDLAKRVEIEQSFGFSESVDDHVLRLTGKEYHDLHMNKIKKSKTRKQHGKRNNSPCSAEVKETVETEGEGAQYITLVMDTLFASQLNMLFGPVGDCEISGDLTTEDRSVVLPLEICDMIHKYWARTVNGKFKHEAEILDSLLRQDEILARKLQEEENNLSVNTEDVSNDSLPEDNPVSFQEIMNLEQALQASLANKTSEDTSISSQLNLQRLYKEYPHVDPVALKEEYTRNGCKYPVTVKCLNQRYGREQGTPKTVIAPEALCRYEQQMIERAQQSSLEEQKAEMSSKQEDEIVPDNPQVYRDEAQAHYHQRQEAFRKAQEAFRQGMKAAAAYYAHIGNLHSEKLREANQRASQKILEAQNAHRKDGNCLDLHLLHVPEALSATQAFLQERRRVLIARSLKQMEVCLITGRGVHSAGGQAVLKPVIREYLQKHGYSFYEANSGMLEVVIRSKSP